jgi:hypothetical protein
MTKTTIVLYLLVCVRILYGHRYHQLLASYLHSLRYHIIAYSSLCVNDQQE